MNLTQLKKTLMSVKGRRSIFISGPPGGGKSSAIHQVYDELEMNFFADVRLGMMDNVEVKGVMIPDLKEKCTIATLPEYFPRDKDAFGILLLDEFDHGTPATQSASYQLLLDHKIGKFELPKNVWVICASNSAIDGGLHFNVPRPVKNRVIQMFVKTEVNEWIPYAIASGISSYIVSFIRSNPEFLFFENKEDNNLPNSLKAFATPRSWFSADVLLDTNDDFLSDVDLFKEVMIGTVGFTATNNFLKFVETAEVAVDVQEIIEGEFSNVSDDLFKTPNAMYYMLTEFESFFQNNKGQSKQTQQGLLEFIDKIPDTLMKSTFFKSLSNAYPRIFTPLAKEIDAKNLRKKIAGEISQYLV